MEGFLFRFEPERLIFFKEIFKKILRKVALKVKKLWKGSEKAVEGFLFCFELERLILF